MRDRANLLLPPDLRIAPPGVSSHRTCALLHTRYNRARCRHADQSAPQSQRAITDAYTSIGRELGALVVPVGVAWHAFLEKHDRPDLYDKDGSHPSLAGSYLAACVFLGTLYVANPAEIDVEVKGLTPADAIRLQSSARDALR